MRYRAKPFNECKKPNVRPFIQQTTRAYSPFNSDSSSRLFEMPTSTKSESSKLPWPQSMMSPYVFIILRKFQYMMARIHLEVQLCDELCIFLKEVWQAQSAWNECSWLSDSVVVVAQEDAKVFRACGGGRRNLVTTYLRFPKISKLILKAKYFRSYINLKLGHFYWDTHISTISLYFCNRYSV